MREFLPLRFPQGEKEIKAQPHIGGVIPSRPTLTRLASSVGLGAGGQAGVAKAIDILAKEMLTTMGLCGVNTIAEINDDVLAV
jgi:FMN-dependent dehydrogenase